LKGDIYSYAEIVRYLENDQTVTFRARTEKFGEITIRANVSWQTQRELDNFHRGFENLRQCICYYPGKLNVLDIDRNYWHTLDWNSITDITI
jgi:hypothetical protein